MWINNLLGVVILCFGFMYLQQITTWTRHSFLFGLVIRKYKKPFLGKMPKEFINKEIICDNILFRFSSPTKGLFRAYPKYRGVLKPTRKFYLPSMLGEINLNHSSFAEIRIRIPWSLIMIVVSLILVLILVNLEDGFTLSTITANIKDYLIGIIVFGVLFFLGSIVEIIDLDDGIKELDERIKSDTL